MSRTSVITSPMRILGALCVALLLYSATPHLHAAEGDRLAGRSFADSTSIAAEHAAHGLAPAADGERSARPAGLLSDDAHDTHSASALVDAHPCTLCRNTASRIAPPPPAALVRLVARVLAVAARAPVASRPELVVARRHPSRAPPLA